MSDEAKKMREAAANAIRQHYLDCSSDDTAPAYMDALINAEQLVRRTPLPPEAQGDAAAKRGVVVPREFLHYVAKKCDGLAATWANDLLSAPAEGKIADLGHKTRSSDSSIYDEVCELCGATDASGDNRLNEPCKGKIAAPQASPSVAPSDSEFGSADGPAGAAPELTREEIEIFRSSVTNGEWRNRLCDMALAKLDLERQLADARPSEEAVRWAQRVQETGFCNGYVSDEDSKAAASHILRLAKGGKP